jgi:type 1 fimbria pilin
MSRLRMMQVSTTTAMLCMGLAVVLKVAAGGTHTFTGKVSDAMCGAKHSEGNIAPADCVRACVQKGANYALVVGDKVYTLDTKDQAVSAELNKLAWQQAKVTGTAKGDTISVESVTATK